MNTHCTVANPPSLPLNKIINNEMNNKRRIQKSEKKNAVIYITGRFQPKPASNIYLYISSCFINGCLLLPTAEDATHTLFLFTFLYSCFIVHFVIVCFVKG